MQAGLDSDKCKQYINKLFDESVIPSLSKYI